MAFITPKELETHLYKENIEAISREDETILTAAIDAACRKHTDILVRMTAKRFSRPQGAKETPSYSFL